MGKSCSTINWGAPVSPFLLKLSAVIVCIIAILETAVVAGSKQAIVEEPQDTRALQNSTAVLRCRVENQVGVLTWTKDRFLLGTDRSLPGYPRYSMIGSSSNNEYHLEIRNVQLSDDAMYQCQLANTIDQPFRRSAAVRLTVLVPPKPPRLVPSTTPISAREGRNVTLTCETEEGKPAAFISWALVRHANGSGFVRKLYAPGESLIRNRGQKFDTQSTLEYSPQRSDDGSYLACLVDHETLTNALVATAQLRIQYSPKVNVTLNSTEPLSEGQRAVLSCGVDAYPSDNLAYTWYQNKRRLHDRKDRYLLISSLSAHDHQNSVFECHADNGVGEAGIGEYTLRMRYKPLIESPLLPELFFNENETVVLRCDARANPPAKIKWYKGSSMQELSHGKNLTLHKLQYSDQGIYLCKAYSEDPFFEPATRQFKVYINGPPRVEIRSLIYARKGAENFQLHCNVRSPPGSKLDITWKRGDDDVVTNDGHYAVEDPRVEGASHRSTLTIRKVEPSDFGIYNCSAENPWGSSGAHSGITHLVQAEEFPTYAILGVAGGCLAILALALALIIVNRKYLCRSKSSTSGDDQSDVTVKCEVFDSNGIPLYCYPDMYNSGGDCQEQHKGYVQVSQDNPDLDMLPPPPTYYTTSPVVSNTTFGNGIVNGMNHYGHSSPINGHLTYMTYLDDSISPTTTATTIVTSCYGDQRHLNGYARPLSPLSPTAIGVPGPAPSTTTSYLPHVHYQPHGDNLPMQPQTYDGRYPNVDLLNGLFAAGAIPNGSCVVPYGFVGTDSSAPYRPLTEFGDQAPYFPSGVHASPLETLHEVPTPDAMDEPQPLPLNGYDQPHLRQMRSSPPATDGVTRCASQLSTHV